VYGQLPPLLHHCVCLFSITCGHCFTFQGKGLQKTYWLDGRKGLSLPLLSSLVDVNGVEPALAVQNIEWSTSVWNNLVFNVVICVWLSILNSWTNSIYMTTVWYLTLEFFYCDYAIFAVSSWVGYLACYYRRCFRFRFMFVCMYFACQWWCKKWCYFVIKRSMSGHAVL